MASLQESDKLKSTLAQQLYDFDPNGTSAVDVAWVDLRDFKQFLACFFRTVGTGVLTAFQILANAESDGSGTDVVVKTHAIGSEPNALEDQLYLECTSEEIGALGDTNGEDLRFVTVSLQFATGTDEGVVAYTRKGGRFSHEDLTIDRVA